jgi:hypothetical protein
MSLDVTPPDGSVAPSVHVQKGASTVTLPVIGELDVAAVPGLRRAIASLNGDAHAVVLDLSRATFVDSSTTREQVVRDIDRERTARRPPVIKLGLLGRDRAKISVDGRPLQLSRRLTEIVALLSARPGGMTSEELAADLYGDAGHPSTVRVQVCRLRKLLGEVVDTERYRLCMDVESDAAHIRSLLEGGAVREAAERYRGPLLPRSEAPGVVRQRDALDAWVRHAVMTADDGAALWAWLQSPSGCDDLPAWKRLLPRLNFHDPRRSLAAARVRSLRQAHWTRGAAPAARSVDWTPSGSGAGTISVAADAETTLMRAADAPAAG